MLTTLLTDVADYLRVSSEDQAERETIENQVDFSKKYCDLHEITLVDSFRDDGISGTLPLNERPEGQRLIEAAKAGKIKVVLIYNLKRLGRSARVILNAVHELEKYGVIIKSMTEPFDTGNPTGRFLLTILAGVAELDRETTLETMWHGANRAARKGKWLGGIVPYGYFVNDERYLEISEEPLIGKSDMTEASVIRLVFNLIAHQKYTTVQLANYFNTLAIPPSYTKDGRKIKKGKRKEATAGIWTPSRISSMIRNTTYKGIHVYGKRSKKERELIERTMPAIVDEDTWDLAQEALKDNQIEGIKNSKRNYLLRGLIKCGVCGLSYHGTAYSSTKAYYICGGKTAYRGKYLGKCTSKNLPAEWIENNIWNECVDFINNPGDTLQELAEGMQENKSHKVDLSEERELVNKSLKDKDLDKQSILDLFRKKIISASDVERQLQEIMKEQDELELRVMKLDKMIEREDGLIYQLDTAEVLLSTLKTKLTMDPLPFEIKREIIKILVKKIIANTNDTNGSFKPQLTATVNYMFSKREKVKDADGTLVLAGFMDLNVKEKAALAHRR